VATRRRAAQPRAGKAEVSAADRPPPQSARLSIVGLGASAGGLEAFETFLQHMPAETGMGFVLVQHLDPSHASVLTEILQRCTSMPVVEARHEMAVEANRVHVIPPNRDMVIAGGALQLSLPTEPRGQRMPIDAFLRSLAADQGEAACGIILSGTGSDGALGLRAIAGAGGLCLVQEPTTAKFDGMPNAAIAAGYPTQVLPVEQMPGALQRGTRLLSRPPAPAAGDAAGGLDKVLRLLRASTGHDFLQYKKSTIGRRIERRMAAHNIDDTAAYARFLGEHPGETQALFRELLINVTQFFRDPPAFVTLREDILPSLLGGRSEDDVLRIWVAGCATGEEAYSIAILLRELMLEMRREVKVQMYSTDLDDDAIATARAGLYPFNIAQDMSPERLRRFFVKEETGYRVKKEIREMVVFAVQSVIKDPPFTRLDLLVCRNLLIYLEPDLQDRLFALFHYALKPRGVLFLSPSESIGHHGDLFEALDRQWKFYRARPTVASRRALLAGGVPLPGALVPARPDRVTRAREFDVAERARRALLQSFAPAAVVTNLQGEIQYVHGDTGRFLRLAPGQPTHDVVEMAREGLQPDLRAALRLAIDKGTPTVNQVFSLGGDGEPKAMALSVHLLPDAHGQHKLLLVTFQDRPASAPSKPARAHRAKAGEEDERVQALQRELAQAKGQMTVLIEEQQASNEELMSTNEEMQSTNEELQSTNEELETSKEELQSMNEELMTVNAELQNKIEQMASMQDDMKNLLDNMRVGTIFLDSRLRIRRFTRDATAIYHLAATDIGRPLADIRSQLQGADLLVDAKAVVDSLVPVEREVRTAEGTSYLARIQPYRTVDNVIDGVVMTFPDVTERLQAIAARTARDLAAAVVEAVPVPLVVLDGKLAVISANQAFYRAFGGTPQDCAGGSFFAIADGHWDAPAMHELLESQLPRERSFEQRDVALATRGGDTRQVRITARRLAHAGAKDELVLLAIEVLEGQRP